MKQPKYPLEEIAEIKKKRLEEAEKTLREKKEILNTEEERLRQAEEKRDLVKKHKYDKIRKYLAELDIGTTSDKIELHQRYIKQVVEEELKVEEKKVLDQQKVVKKAEEEVEKARQDRLRKHQEMEKMHLHRQEWQKEINQEAARKEVEENDELGSNMHTLRSRKAPHPFKSPKKDDPQ